MQNFKKLTLASLLLVSLNVSASPFSWLSDLYNGTGAASSKSSSELNVSTTAEKLEKAAPNLDPKVINLALTAYEKARAKGYDKQNMLSVIDFSLPSYDKSLWVFNLNNDSLLYNTYVAHGKNSGDTTATQFSNSPRSLESSLGLYLTGDTYYGHDGLAMRLYGLSGSFNDNVYSREVVMHGAWYVNQSFLDANHRLGRSWGCPAVPQTMIAPITDNIKNGTLIYAYANDPSFLADPTVVA